MLIRPTWLPSLAKRQAEISSARLTGAGYEVCVKIDLSAKVAAFCRELGDSTPSDMARQEMDMEPVCSAQRNR
jgi:hypothetical protein